MRVRKGIPVSPGVAVGQAYCIDEIFVGNIAELVDASNVAAECHRFEGACEQTAVDLRALYNKVAAQVGEQEAAVFAHETILHDPAFRAKVNGWIVDHRQSAPMALQSTLTEYTSLFSRTKDDYLKERISDLRDVILRISAHLSEALQPESDALGESVIVVANEVLPSQAIYLRGCEVAGFVTQIGGRTSHAAILARSRGVPAITGVDGIFRAVNNGDTIIVDGRDGHVFLHPDPETESAYRKVQREFFHLKDTLIENRDQPAVSADGEPVQLLANINDVDGAIKAAKVGGAGIGLFRTEYLFLTHPDVPDEQEQRAAYREVIKHGPGHCVTIRTLDIGGDKTIAYLGHHREANPFMGWRSIRLSFEHPQFFLRQIRAILLAAHDQRPQGDVRILFPMITTLEEMRRICSLVRKARRQLGREDKQVGEIPIGLMVEVPAAAISIRTLLDAVDFVSIGSNDLVQYLMAADRDNPKVAHLCEPLSPPVLRVLYDVIQACIAADKPVTVCGEMAGQPRAVVLLYAMGLRSFSMSPAFIPSIKELVSHLTQENTARVLQQVWRLKTNGQIARFMSEQLDQLCPSLKLLDSR